MRSLERVADGRRVKAVPAFLRTVMRLPKWCARRSRRAVMAKGQQRSNKEVRKPKKAKPKINASNPSQKGGQRGLENLKNS